MNFFQVVRDSLRNPEFYEALRAEQVGKAFRHFSLLILCVTIVTVASLYITFGSWQEGVNLARTYQEKIIDAYPAELELIFQDGKATSNVQEPYIIPVPAEFNTAATDPKNLIVINTQGTVSVSDFKTHDTYAILGGDAIGVSDPSNGKVDIRKFGEFKETFTLNKEKVSELVMIAAKYLKVVAIVFLIILPFIIFAGTWIGMLVYLLFGAVVIWIVAKLKKITITYGEAYLMGLYLIAIPLGYQILTGLFPMLYVPYLFTLILAVMAYINIEPAKITETTSIPEKIESKPKETQEGKE